MSYVDAGYTIVFVVLALYTVSLLARRRRLERAATRAVNEQRFSGQGATTRGFARGDDTVLVDDASSRDPGR